MEAIGLLILLLIGVFFVFPIYVLVKLAELGNDVRTLKARLAALAARDSSERFDAQSMQSRQAPQAAAPHREAWGMATQQSPPPPAPSPPARSSKPIPAWLTDVQLPPLTPKPSSAAISSARQLSFDFDIERLLGANWLAKLGIAAIAIGVGFFLQYAFRNDWISPTAQVGIGLAGSAALLIASQALIRKPVYRNYAQVLASGGIIVYFLSVYAAYAFYQPRLIGFGPGFAAMAAGALGASALALANNTQVVAILCVIGAFATPVLIREPGSGSGASNLLQLYAYIALLNVWVLGLIRLRSWHSLAVVAFASTWLLFFEAGPLQGKGWAAEGFAVYFLLASCFMGLQALQTSAKASTNSGGELPELQKVGIGLIIGGSLAFGWASSVILAGHGIFGFSDLMLAGSFLSVMLAAVPALLPERESQDNEVRNGLRYLSAVALVIMILGALAMATGREVPREQAMYAFGFSVFNYLLFTAIAFAMARRKDAQGPAAAMIIANGVVHVAMAHTSLGTIAFWGVPALTLWLPAAGLIAVSSIWFANEQESDEFALPVALSVNAMAYPVIASLVALGQPRLPAGAMWLFAGEFAALSLGFAALRQRIAWQQFRADLIAPFAFAGAFFVLAERCLGLHEFGSLVLLAGVSVVLAMYHALIAGWLIANPDEDPLRVLIYQGIAVTFLTVAIPLQLKASYITLAWAVEAVALIYAGVAARNSKARFAGLALFMLTAVKALLLDLPRKPEAFVFLANQRMLAGVAVIAAAYIAAAMFRNGSEDLEPEERPAIGGLTALANLFTLIFVSVDLWDYFGQMGSSSGMVNAQHLALSLFWTVYALGLVSVGIWRRSRPTRLLSMGLLYVSIFKVFLLDLSGLEQPYKIVSFLALGVILLFISLLYTRFEARLQDDEESAAPGPSTPLHHAV